MDRQKQAYIYAVMTLLLWATVASAFKITLRYAHFIQMLCWASFTSMAFLLLMVIIQGKWPLVVACSRRDVLHSALLGFLNPFLYYLILFKSYSLLPAQEAQPLNYTWPIMLALLSAAILRQKIGFMSWAAILISFSGVLVISTQGYIKGFRFSDPLGVILALSSSVIWALFWIFNVKDRRDEVVKLFLNFSFGFIFTLATIIFSPEKILPLWPGLFGSFYVGLFEMGVTFVLWLKALTLSRTTAQVSHLIYLSPFVSMIFIHWTVGETILPSSMVGLALIVAGVAVQRFEKN